MIKVSIIIPVYNGEKFLEKCIKSALNQNFDKNEYEIIIVDDCSTDSSKIIIEEYCSKYKNIIPIYKNNNFGEPHSCNLGIANANGDYICILHQDDMLEKELIKKCYSLAEKDKLDVVHFGFQEIKVNKEDQILHTENQFCNLTLNDKIVSGKELFINCNWVGPMFAYFISKKFFIDNNLFLQAYAFDTFTMFKILINVDRMIHLNEHLYVRRIHNENYSNEFSTATYRFCACARLTLNSYLDYVVKIKNRDSRLKSSLKKYFYMLFTTCIKMHKVQIFGDKALLFIGDINYSLSKYFQVFGQELEIFECIKIEKLYDLYRKYCNEQYCIIDKELLKIIESAIEKLDIYRKSLLVHIPLGNKDKKIAIYGIGTHTDNLLKFYTKNIGSIEAEVFYIDSYKGNDGEKYMDKNIINIKNINSYDFDMIVLSSASYEKDMYKNVLNNTNKSIDIIKFYDYLEESLF